MDYYSARNPLEKQERPKAVNFTGLQLIQYVVSLDAI